MTLPPIAYLKQILRYDPVTGKLFWRYRKDRAQNWNSKNADKEAGSLDKTKGYIRLCIDDKFYYAHRVAWAIYYNEDPGPLIDHRNTIRNQNWIDNLRKNTHSGNIRNTQVSRINKTGYTGVYYHKHSGKYRAEIMVNLKRVSLGYHDTAEQAGVVYNEALASHAKVS